MRSAGGLGRSLPLSRAIMVAGLSDDTPWALETIEVHKADAGFLLDAYDAAKYAMERHRWSNHWARAMRDATIPEELWCAGVLLGTVVDGRFDGALARGGPKPELMERFGRTFNDGICDRIKKWKDKRQKKLFGETAPDDIYLA